MPAPKRPNTAAATAAVVRNAQERKAAELRAAGWTVWPPTSEERTTNFDIAQWILDDAGGADESVREFAAQVADRLRATPFTVIEACDGLTEAQVDHFVQAPCGRRDTHSAH